MATAICAPLINSRRSFLALAWTLTTLLSFFCFGLAVFLATRINQQYNAMTTDDYINWYSTEYMNKYGRNWGNNCRFLEGGGEQQREGGEQQRQGEEDHERQGEGEEHNKEGCQSNDDTQFDVEFFESLINANSRSLEFAGVYTSVMGIALSLYGSTVVVGFMSLKGEFIPPCFSFRSMSLDDESVIGHEDHITGPRKLWGEKIHRGVFLGCLVIFSNLLLICSVIFGELTVLNNNNNNDRESANKILSYRIERISSIFAITCIVLAFVYTLFAVIYLSCGGMTDDNSSRHSNNEWINHAQYELSSRSRRRHRGRRNSPNSIDKSEPLVSGIGGITDNGGFITDMISNSSGSSQMSRDWSGGQRQYNGQLA